jgi:hypothetical protein
MGHGLTYRREMLASLRQRLIPEEMNRAQIRWPTTDFDSPLDRRGDSLFSLYEFYGLEREFTPAMMDDAITKSLPPSWIVVSIGTIGDSEDLVIRRLSLREPPVLLRLTGCRVGAEQPNFSVSDALQRLRTIIEKSDEITRTGKECDTKEKQREWWRSRQSLDTELQRLLDEMEQSWIGGFKVCVSLFDVYSFRAFSLVLWLGKKRTVLNSHQRLDNWFIVPYVAARRAQT